jgi:serine/threonine protein kinase
VGDFGLSIFENAKAESGMTGTAAYLAPEILEGAHYTIKADVKFHFTLHFTHSYVLLPPFHYLSIHHFVPLPFHFCPLFPLPAFPLPSFPLPTSFNSLFHFFLQYTPLTLEQVYSFAVVFWELVNTTLKRMQ